MPENHLQTLCALPWSNKEEDLQLWSMKFCVCGTAHSYGDILDGKVLCPMPDAIAMLNGETS